MNNSPKVVTQRCLEQDLNLRPTDRKPKCLTVTPPRHLVTCYNINKLTYLLTYDIDAGKLDLCGQIARQLAHLPPPDLHASAVTCGTKHRLHV